MPSLRLCQLSLLLCKDLRQDSFPCLQGASHTAVWAASSLVSFPAFPLFLVPQFHVQSLSIKITKRMKSTKEIRLENAISPVVFLECAFDLKVLENTALKKCEAASNIHGICTLICVDMGGMGSWPPCLMEQPVFRVA